MELGIRIQFGIAGYDKKELYTNNAKTMFIT